MATNTKDGLLGFVEEVTARVGGPSFLDPRQLLYAGPIVFLASVIFRQGLPSAGNFNIEIITQGLSICLTYLFAICLSRLTKAQREKKPFNFVQIILAGAVIGSVKFYSVELSIRLMLPEELVPGRIGALLMTVLIFSLLLIPGLSYAESKRIDFEKDRAEMVQRKTGASLARARVEKIDPQIERFLSSLRNMRLTPKPEFHQKLALEIRDFVENEVRPLSRQLWKIEDQKNNQIFFLGPFGGDFKKPTVYSTSHGFGVCPDPIFSLAEHSQLRGCAGKNNLQHGRNFSSALCRSNHWSTIWLSSNRLCGEHSACGTFCRLPQPNSVFPQYPNFWSQALDPDDFLDWIACCIYGANTNSSQECVIHC